MTHSIAYAQVRRFLDQISPYPDKGIGHVTLPVSKVTLGTGFSQSWIQSL